MRWYFWWVYRRDVHPAQRYQRLFQWLCHDWLGVGREQRELPGCLIASNCWLATVTVSAALRCTNG